MLSKYAFLGWFGGSCYVTFEVFWRGYSHWTMFLLGAILFVLIDLLNEIWPNWKILPQAIVSSFMVTIFEFITGYIVNIQLGWNIWDYSNIPFNILGQICPQFTFLWIALSILAIVIGDIIRWKFFNEEKPHYNLIKKK